MEISTTPSLPVANEAPELHRTLSPQLKSTTLKNNLHARANRACTRVQNHSLLRSTDCQLQNG